MTHPLIPLNLPAWILLFRYLPPLQCLPAPPDSHQERSEFSDRTSWLPRRQDKQWDEETAVRRDTTDRQCCDEHKPRDGWDEKKAEVRFLEIVRLTNMMRFTSKIFHLPFHGAVGVVESPFFKVVWSSRACLTSNRRSRKVAVTLQSSYFKVACKKCR